MDTSEVCRQVKKLNAPQLEAVAAFIADLLATEPEQAEPSDNGHEAKTSGGAGGWVELKTINGHGPYAYRRWHDGKRTRSKYIGKAKA